MNYDGIEIFFQNLGDADSIFLRHWNNGQLTNILIDGGWSSSADQVTQFLQERGAETGDYTIHHLICTHAHDDHAGGLVELVNRAKFPITQAWVHDTRAVHVPLTANRLYGLQQANASLLLKKIQASEKTRNELLSALEKRGITPISPFAGRRIGPLVVLGPTESFFDQQFAKLDVPDFVRQLEQRIKVRTLSGMLQDPLAAAVAVKEDEAELGGEPTSPENEVSTVLALQCNNSNYLFTADAGCEAFTDIVVRVGEQLRSLGWMQVPHHGSRRNLTQSLLNFFAPSTAFISCSGSPKHPSKKLVNALKGTGTKVYSTHYSVDAGNWLRHHNGNVLAVPTVPAIQLYDKG